MEKIKTLNRGQVLVNAGEFGPVMRITEGVFRPERLGMDGLSLVQLGLPGDLIGVESLCAELTLPMVGHARPFRNIHVMNIVQKRFGYLFHRGFEAGPFAPPPSVFFCPPSCRLS